MTAKLSHDLFLWHLALFYSWIKRTLPYLQICEQRYDMSATFAIVVIGPDCICCILCSHMCCLSEYMLSSRLLLADTLSGTCHSALVNSDLVTVGLLV